jgi:hypothetical protein
MRTPRRHAATSGWGNWTHRELDASTIRTPLAFTDMLYTLRVHIDLVREMIVRRTSP